MGNFFQVRNHPTPPGEERNELGSDADPEANSIFVDVMDYVSDAAAEPPALDSCELGFDNHEPEADIVSVEMMDYVSDAERRELPILGRCGLQRQRSKKTGRFISSAVTLLSPDDRWVGKTPCARGEL